MLVTDAVGSTVFRHAQGDALAHARIAKMESLVSQASTALGGRVVKNTGDGQLVVFESARSAVSAALEIQRDIHALNSEHPTGAITLRAGIHTGEAIVDAADVQGTAVVAAFRINGKAESEEILVSEMVRGVLGGATEFGFVERGRFRLKGFRERWRLYHVPWRSVAAEPAELDCAILFTDVRDSTTTLFELGDRDAFRYLSALHAILRAATAANAALFVRLLGDGVMAAFATAEQAVRAATEIREATNAYTSENPSSPMRTAIGIHQGNLIFDAGEIYGHAIFVALKALRQAGPSEVLLTEEIRDSLPPDLFRLGAPHRATLDAIPGERMLYPLQ